MEILNEIIFKVTRIRCWKVSGIVFMILFIHNYKQIFLIKNILII
jgi:hypothetical protein